MSEGNNDKTSFWRFFKINYLFFVVAMWAIFLLFLYLPMIWGSDPTRLEELVIYSLITGISLVAFIGSLISYRKL